MIPVDPDKIAVTSVPGVDGVSLLVGKNRIEPWMADHEDQLACANCHLILQREELWSGHHHSGEIVGMRISHLSAAFAGEVHIPQPVPRKTIEQRSVCDFCGAEGATWSYPCGGFMIDLPAQDGVTVDYELVGAWVACDKCHRDIDQDAWRQVLNRWERNHRRYHLPGASKAVMTVAKQRTRLLQAGFREHRQGVATPWGGK